MRSVRSISRTLLFISLGFAVAVQTASLGQTSPQGPQQGAGGLVDFLAQQLNLTPDQREKARVILERAQRDAEAVRNGASLSEESRRDRLQQINRSKREQMNAILTPEQQQKMSELLQGSNRPGFPEGNNGPRNGPRPNFPRGPAGQKPEAPSGPLFSATPLTDFKPGQKYLGQFDGFLYEGSNDPPPAHDSKGKQFASEIRPLDKNGTPSPSGKIVFLSVGFSNPQIEWCGPSLRHPQDCFNESFIKQAMASPKIDKSTVVILNGAIGGQPTRVWGDPNARDYDLVRDRVLSASGVSEKQVQAVWMEVVEPSPTVSLPSRDADAYKLEALAGEACRALKARYPNLKQLFISPRSYGGYAHAGSPEPFAYETGFSVKWLIEAQIRQMATGQVEERAGDLNYNSGIAPWITWGPYFWASGSTPRSDGLSYGRDDYRDTDGLHPSFQGIRKIAGFMLKWFENSPYTPWLKNPGAHGSAL
jgi:Spy/CpxP family protein refolding chaperone